MSLEDIKEFFRWIKWSFYSDKKLQEYLNHRIATHPSINEQHSRTNLDGWESIDYLSTELLEEIWSYNQKRWDDGRALMGHNMLTSLYEYIRMRRSMKLYRELLINTGESHTLDNIWYPVRYVKFSQ